MGLGTLGGGVGTAKFLAKQGAKVLATDLKSRAELANSLKQLKSFPIKYVLGRHRITDFTNTGLVVKNPAVPKNSPFLKAAERRDIPIENDASLFFNYCPNPIIGVTGSKGKSTTVALLERMLKKGKVPVVLAGHNTTSVLDRIELLKKKDWVLFELSSWRLEGLAKIKKSPQIAVITNLVPDHLNTYRGMREYQEAKKKIYQFQNSRDYVILNRDNKITRSFGKEVPSQRYWFSLKSFSEQNGAFIKNNKIFFRSYGKESLVLDLSTLKLLGKHNVQNALAAVIVAKILKISNRNIADVLRSFKGMPGRIELVRILKGAKYFNDTAATIPDATIAALDSFNKKVILIVGGQNKKLNYSNLSRKIIKRTKQLILLPGSASDEIEKLLKRRHFSFTKCNSLSSAVLAARQRAEREDVILFSPGAASFNLFRNEFDRGDQFKKFVNKLS